MIGSCRISMDWIMRGARIMFWLIFCAMIGDMDMLMRRHPVSSESRRRGGALLRSPCGEASGGLSARRFGLNPPRSTRRLAS
jgi:hypothetical protein